MDSDIEYFLHEKAILFHKLGISRTYLVYTSYKDKKELVGYFAIAPKVLRIKNNVSISLRKKLVGTKSNGINEIPVFLIGQLSKNYRDGLDKLISGDELLYLTMKK
ncbi:MAG TPA: hypothetical protein PKA28_19495 [Methylomusa anaerophila]|uniref:hypothetical protein n=1 Tax=Methylomusa anaerophila TaxID=1930071 RepID=UPI0011AE184D|nr:hypothetical protein [Methylomusa anaerophila]HML90621.1 hypothetical protein [Methylomusa anaerophila]